MWEICEIAKKLYKSSTFVYHAKLCAKKCSQIMNRMEEELLKNTKFIALSLGLLFTLGIQGQTVEAQTKETVETCQVKDKDSVIDAITNRYAFMGSELTYKKTIGDTLVYENDQMEIKVNGLDLMQTGKQPVFITYSLKDSKAMFEKMGGKALEGVSSDFIIQTTLDVQDTTAPQIQVQDRYDILQGDDFDLSKEIKVSDETEDVSVDVQGTIDTTTAGSYTATIIATDDAGNQTSKEVQVVVDKKEDPNFYQKIADAALAQIGVHQDCTMLVTNSLKAVGINFHGAPSAYLSLGDLTNDPVPGDICVYQGHVAIYIGNGQAVHGGWNGYTTQIFSVNCSNQLIGYVHVRQ